MSVANKFSITGLVLPIKFQSVVELRERTTGPLLLVEAPYNSPGGQVSEGPLPVRVEYL